MDLDRYETLRAGIGTDRVRVGIVRHQPLVVDARNPTRDIVDGRERIVRA